MAESESLAVVCRQGGCAVRLFHKELEAYLVAEGLFEDDITEDGESLAPHGLK